ARSMVSFERVFEVIDLPVEIDEKPDALALENVRGEIAFEGVTFNYHVDERLLLSNVDRPRRMDSVQAVFSIDDPNLAARKQTNGSKNGTTAYAQARENALDNVTFTIQPGQ